MATQATHTLFWMATFESGEEISKRWTREKSTTVTKDRRWGFIDQSGNTRIEPRFQHASSFRESYAIVLSDTGREVIDIDGDSQLSLEVEQKSSGMSDGALIAQGGDCNDRVYLDSFATVQVARDGITLGDAFEEGLCRFWDENYKYGYLNQAFDEVILPSFDGAANVSEGFAKVRIGCEEWLLDFEGNKRFGPYDSIDQVHCGYAVVDNNGAPGILDTRDNSWVELDGLVSIRNIWHPQIVFAFDGKQKFLMQRDGSTRDRFFIDNVGIFREGIASASKGGHWGLINDDLNWVVPPSFDVMSLFSNGIAIGKKEGKSYALNRDGETLWQSQASVFGPPSFGLMPFFI